MTLAAALLLPLLAAMALAFPGTRRPVLLATPWLPLAGLAAALAAPAPLRLDGVLLGLVLALDPSARLLLASCALIWACAGWALLRAEAEVPGVRLAAWHLTLFGNVGALAAQDGPGFYLFFAVLSIAVYGVLVRDAGGRAAGRRYLAVALTAELLFLAGAMLLALDRPGPTAALLVLFGLGAKLGLLPLHFPLPPAYAAAGAAGGAVFAGALSSAAIAGLIRFLPAAAPQPAVGTYAVVAGLAAAFLGALAGSLQRDPRALLGYSTVSQMGLLTVAVGLALAAPGPWPAAALTLFAVHHGLVKAALMLGTGSGGTLALALTAVLSLALAGAPQSGGALAKAWFDKLAQHAPEQLAGATHTLLPLTATATALLMARLVWLLRDAPRGPAHAPFLLLAAVALVAPPLTAGLLHSNPAELVKPLWDSLWPLLLAVPLITVAAFARRRLPALPPGDLAHWAPRAEAALRRLALPSLVGRLPAPRWPGFAFDAGERRMRNLPVVGLLFFALLFAFVLAWDGVPTY